MHTPTVFLDKDNPGVVRFSDDPSAGFIAGRRAAFIVQAVNAHERLVDGIKRIQQYAEKCADTKNVTIGRLYMEGVEKMASELLAELKGGK